MAAFFMWGLGGGGNSGPFFHLEGTFGPLFMKSQKQHWCIDVIVYSKIKSKLAIPLPGRQGQPLLYDDSSLISKLVVHQELVSRIAKFCLLLRTVCAFRVLSQLWMICMTHISCVTVHCVSEYSLQYLHRPAKGGDEVPWTGSGQRVRSKVPSCFTVTVQHLDSDKHFPSPWAGGDTSVSLTFFVWQLLNCERPDCTPAVDVVLGQGQTEELTIYQDESLQHSQTAGWWHLRQCLTRHHHWNRRESGH